MCNEISLPQAYQRPSGKMYLNVLQQNLEHGAVTLVLLDTIPANYVDGIENTGTHRITPGIPGYYSIVGQITFSQPTVNTSYQCTIKVSGVSVVMDTKHSSQAYDLTVKCVLPCHYLSEIDFVELYATSRSGDNTVDILNSEVQTFLSVQRVR